MCCRRAGHRTVLQLQGTPHSEQNRGLARSHANEEELPPKLGITGAAASKKVPERAPDQEPDVRRASGLAVLHSARPPPTAPRSPPLSSGRWNRRPPVD